MTTKGQTRAQARGLGNRARQAWNRRDPESDQAEFTWRGERYVVSRVEDEFRLSVETPDGKAVASLYD